MAPVVIDAELLARLTANGGRVPIADHTGKVVGHFEAAASVEGENDWMYREPTAEELRRSFAKGGRHTMDEVFKLLEE